MGSIEGVAGTGLPDFTVLIPARHASSRLPGKALADIAGKPMVVHVAERAQASGARRVVVATDDARIADAANRYGIEAIITRGDHATGTDRLAEAAAALALDADEIVVNVQGDEPLLDPALRERTRNHVLDGLLPTDRRGIGVSGRQTGRRHQQGHVCRVCR